MFKGRGLELSLLVLIIIVFTATFATLYFRPSISTVEASNKTRFQVQDTQNTLINPFASTHLSVVCDTETGNLLYIVLNGYGTGTAVVPNGCHKDPQ